MSNKTLEDRLSIIKNKAKNDMENIAKKENERITKETELINKIEKLTERISTLIVLANKCVEMGIKFPMSSETNKYGYGKGGYSYNFFADGIFHHVGFMGIEYKSKEIKYLGIYQGGACGKYDFYTNGKETFSLHEDTHLRSEAKIEHMEWFLKEFPVFEKAFYKWIDSME